MPLFCLVLLAIGHRDQPWFSVGRDHTWGNARRPGSLRTDLEADYLMGLPWVITGGAQGFSSHAVLPRTRSDMLPDARVLLA